MALDRYYIRSGIDKSRGDTEISLSSSQGLSLRPMPVRLLLLYLASLMGLMVVLFRTFVAQASLPTKVVLVALWVAMTALLLVRDASGEPKYELIGAIPGYVLRRSRSVTCRSSSPARGFAGICGIESVVPESCPERVIWNDGTQSYVYAIVGYGSTLLFSHDRSNIIAQTERFWRNVPDDVEWVFVTCRGPQNVGPQLERAARRREALARSGDADPELLALAAEEERYLSEYVGDRLHSIHQYLIVKAPNAEALRDAETYLRQAFRQLPLVFKSVELLSGERLCYVLRQVVGGDGA